MHHALVCAYNWGHDGAPLCRPEVRALAAVEKYVVANADNLTPADVKDFLVAFAAIESPPQAVMVNAAILQLPAKFADTTPHDMSLLLSVCFHFPLPPQPCLATWPSASV